MEPKYRKIKKYLKFLDEQRYTEGIGVGEITICPCDYKTSNTPPSLDEFTPFVNADFWGTGRDSHAWFHFEFDVPENMKALPLHLIIKTDKTGWDACNPQFMVYINGKFRQGIDINHTFIEIVDEDHCDVYVYGYTGPNVDRSRFAARLRNLNYETEQLFYDIKVPFEMLDYLNPNSKEYSEILTYLDKATKYLDLYEIGSEEFFESVKIAREFMQNEFYGKYCSTQWGYNPATTVGIGHTHIDCAWLWTLKQTREKVQRSFATVLELMKHYPEYKFMSSQALLYKYLKEEAPELYEQIKQRVKEGRWEVEGAMWVEADCNLSSGESLIRQVMYGKQFFKDEFGVNNRILWLPDVFGYAAALPQILKKSGVDWFVTSKISWNDTNTMPNDTFKWIGIDGTEINTYFLSAQDQKGPEPDRYTTYVGNTGSKMISGTYNRFNNKELTNETLLTFGYGDGGGGPTAEMLEQGRRTAMGIPGAPIFKIDFAGDFLKRLEEKIENNPLLPSWRGELYLEFHRGTYTSVAKNKRNNRKSEFMYQNAELISVIDKAINGTAFPKAELHEGWETILTNQFHDIIPGSSIREVYEQCDIDYAKVFDIGNTVISNAENNIASKLDKNSGYAVFNPHSFETDALVKINGVTAIAKSLPSKGYKLTNSFVTANSVKIDGKTVETDIYTVKFDNCMQITSIYDKLNAREVIKAGAVANEIRVYADHPDQFEAWEWQEYSLEKYETVTALESVQEVEDGVRRGIRLVRPYRQSKITQTIWFTDSGEEITFDTVADWHQQHLMVKTAFPVDINCDKATYEIQFGTVERPTHKNTSWDSAKFEVCAQKYADISEGGYGVSIINDCKYGHDIHDSVIMLSLLKCPTHPDETADQGEIPFVYSIYPHKGSFADCDTAKKAYYMNYPVKAVKTTGEANEIPESFSAVTLNADNVICETVKDAEDSSGTVIRLYESKNCRTKLEIKTDITFQKAYLCDLSENELEELDVQNGVIKTNINGFEILTVKLV